MPALVDPSPPDGSGPLAMFESGAILLYLAEKTGRFLPADLHGRSQVIQWLFWQMSGVGPTLGQNHHFNVYATEKIPYAIDRFVKETNRLYGCSTTAAGGEFVARRLLIADMACYPWMSGHERQQMKIDEFPEVERWLATIRARPATQRAYARGKEISDGPGVTEEARRFLFGQDASTVRARVIRFHALAGEGSTCSLTHCPAFASATCPPRSRSYPRLTRALGRPRLLVKRDDQTGLASGGNKTRKLEFSVAEALRQDADTLVTLGAVQSNHARQTAAAAARCGLRCVLVLRGRAPTAATGNLLLDHLLGAQVIFSGDRAREEVAAEVVAEQRGAGHRPYLHPGGRVGRGRRGGVRDGARGTPQPARGAAARHRPHRGRQQLLRDPGRPVRGRQGARLPATNRWHRHRCPRAANCRLAWRTSRGGPSTGLGSSCSLAPEEVVAFDGYLGAGYAVMGEPEREAILLAGRHEGLLLDPVYTGRAMAGLINLIRTGEIGRQETVVFWHTGGAAALFAYAEELLDHGE